MATKKAKSKNASRKTAAEQFEQEAEASVVRGKEAADQGLGQLFYASPFDNYQVELCIGPAEALCVKLGIPPEEFNAKDGATIEAVNHGCLIWMPSFDGSPECMSSFFHEVTHASFYRYVSSGMLKGKPTKKNVEKDNVDLGEMVATSVGEIGRGLLSQMAERE